jgi:hypothetical protein
VKSSLDALAIQASMILACVLFRSDESQVETKKAAQAMRGLRLIGQYFA